MPPFTVAAPNYRRGPNSGRRRVLELLAASPDGCTKAIMIAHGFTIEQMVELIRAGLATAKAERVVAAGRTIEVARVRITDAGRRALTGRLWFGTAAAFAISAPLHEPRQ